jgi:hypothetical protein
LAPLAPFRPRALRGLSRASLRKSGKFLAPFENLAGRAGRSYFCGEKAA